MDVNAYLPTSVRPVFTYRSEGGQRWCERIWSVIATCTQQGRSVFEYLHAAVKAYFGDDTVPSLLAEG
jgi:hypothetical protein